jgi:hypothetical protein
MKDHGMAMLIFDRVDVLKAIENACLLAGGRSAVVLSTQKVGKSYLLDHIYNNCLPTDDTLFCRINLDLLRGVNEDQPLTDEVFYRFLVDRLRERLETWIASRSGEEEECKQDIDEAGQVLVALAGLEDADSVAHREAAKRQQRFRRQQMIELASLREISVLADALFNKPTIKAQNLVTILDRLRRNKKRVVLFIDDFQRIVAEPGLTDSLFSFLRAANNDGNLIALASSPVHLMHSSLHPQAGERPSLFNHFAAVRLEPFTDAEADSFLQWLPIDGEPLTAEELSYIRSLSGGAPYFLKAVRDQFVMNHRPAGDARIAFERDLTPALETGFREIWRRCTPEQRTILRDVAANRPIMTAGPDALSLQSDGYLIVNGANARLFSPLFVTFVMQRPPDEPEAPALEATATVMYNVLPTALVFAQPIESAPIVSFKLRNTKSQPVKVRLFCELQGLAPLVERILTLQPSRTPTQQTLTVTIDKEKFQTLKDPGRCQLIWGVDIVTAGVKDPQFSDFTQLKLLARDHFLFARRDPVQKTLVDYTWLIGAWIQKTEQALIEIRQAAAKVHPLIGYPPAGDPDEVRAQVKALYDELKARKLRYDSSALVFHQDDNDFAQRVRTPARVLQENGANCLEGSVLFASLLSASDLAPVILFVPGHAIVGWKTGTAANAPVEFLETTVIETQPFEEAVKSGQAKYAEFMTQYDAWQAFAPKSATDPRVIADPRSFAIAVDIHAVTKARWLVPI